MSNYFRLFPVIEYGKYLAKNITTNVRMSPVTKNNAALYHKYAIKEGDNARTIAGKYYDTEDLDWLVYFANDIIDPYYDCYLHDQQFEEYIVRKYGDLETASRRVVGWINDWRSDDGEIAIATYDALPAKLKTYYDPIIDYNRNLTAYKRSHIDTSTNTNRIIKWALATVITGSSGDLIDIYASSTKIGTCELVSIEDYTITVNHVILDDSDTPTHIEVVGSDTLVSIDGDPVYDYKAISDSEVPFWRHVSCYEAEQVSNDAKKDLRLVSNQFAGEFKRQLKEKLQ
jgi:hypothetical protein